MAISHDHSARGSKSHTHSLLLALLCLAVPACSTTPPAGEARPEDPRGTVSLQAISDRSIQASHPIILNQPLIALVLSGLRVHEHQRALQEMLEGSSSDISVFSDEEVQFLTPRIAKALSTATAGEAVAFVVRSPRRHSGRFENALAETTAGSLYAYDLSLYVTLSQFHYAPGQTQPKPDGTPRLRLLDTSGLSDRSLQFTPSAAQRPESVHRQTGETSPGRTVAIDYQLLQRASPSEAVGEQFPSPAKHVIAPTHGALPESGRAETPSQTAETLAQREAEIHTLKDLVIKKDLELETLRKELQSIKKQLEEQTARPDGRKGKPKPPSNLQHTAP